MDRETKDDLISVLEQLDEESSNLGFGVLIAVFTVLVLGLTIFMPKIYLKHNIYYKSRDLRILKYQYSDLYQENIALKQKLQELKFKNQVVDVIY